jgi:hypothetical protein
LLQSNKDGKKVKINYYLMTICTFFLWYITKGYCQYPDLEILCYTLDRIHSNLRKQLNNNIIISGNIQSAQAI